LAGLLAVELNTQSGSVLTGYYRLPRHLRIDDQQLTARLRQLFENRQQRLAAHAGSGGGLLQTRHLPPAETSNEQAKVRRALAGTYIHTSV